MRSCGIVFYLFLFFVISFAEAKEYKVKPYSKSIYGEYTLYDYQAQRFPQFQDGVKPVYHIFIGRHGSRYIEMGGAYTKIYDMFNGADLKGVLTKKGQDFFQWFKKVYPQWKGHEMQLTGKGRRQLEKHAECLYGWLPQLFEGKTNVRVATSPSPRVIESEESFMRRLMQLHADINMVKDTLDILAAIPYSPVLKKFLSSYLPQRNRMLDSKGFVSVFFSDPLHIKDYGFTEYGFCLYMRNILAGVSSLDMAVPDDYRKLVSKRWLKDILQAINLGTYYGYGRCPLTDGYGANVYKDAWRYIVETTQKDLREDSGITLNLVFSHDIMILNLMAQLRAATFGVELDNLDRISRYWNCSSIPMGSNFQFCICKRQDDSRLIVYPLLNGRSISLPLQEVLPGAYYWDDVARLNL